MCWVFGDGTYVCLQLRLRILFITISPVISNKFNFLCPIDNAQIQVQLSAPCVAPRS